MDSIRKYATRMIFVIMLANSCQKMEALDWNYWSNYVTHTIYALRKKASILQHQIMNQTQSCYYLYKNYKRKPLTTSGDIDTRSIQPPKSVQPQPTQLDKTVVGDVSIYRFNNGWRDVGDIRREFEDSENFGLLSVGFHPPATANIDMNEAEYRNLYDIRNLLLPSAPLIQASKSEMATQRTWDAQKYGTATNKMIYIMRKNTSYRDFVGFIVFYQQPEIPNEGYIELFLVSKAFRGVNNYAQLLTKHALDILKNKGVSRVTLATLRSSERARRFYQKIGFTEQNPQPYGPPTIIFYEIELGNTDKVKNIQASL